MSSLRIWGSLFGNRFGGMVCGLWGPLGLPARDLTLSCLLFSFLSFLYTRTVYLHMAGHKIPIFYSSDKDPIARMGSQEEAQVGRKRQKEAWFN